jgi:hypothetical protein
MLRQAHAGEESRGSDEGAARDRFQPPLAERRSPGGGGGAGGGGGGASGDGDLLSERELKAIEKEHPEGLTSVQVVDLLARRGIRFSEATFRKFVQKGLLPRSRRVGRKGKHQGSLGLYPTTTVRRINVIKKLQADGHTIEDIGRRFLRYRDEIEALERSLTGILDGFEEELRAPHFDVKARKQLKKDLDDTREHALALLERIESFERRVVGPIERPPGGGAPGGAEDLL